jgi:hypothetical protein
MTLHLLPTITSAQPGPEAWSRDEPIGLRPAACSPDLAQEILARLAGDYLTSQVFLDFGRLFRPGRACSGPFERILLVDLERHTRFLHRSLELIAAAFADAGGQGSLFALTGDGALLLHPLTRASIAMICREARTAPAISLAA